jgi:sugar O-acyltransferase (sialic acid O-acetyltransferase NeuD family)
MDRLGDLVQTKRKIVILGAGGFAREVRWLLEEIGEASGPHLHFLGYVVSDLAKVGPHDSKDQILGDYDWLDSYHHDVDALALGIGTPQARRRVGLELRASFPELEWPALIHPSVHLDRGSCEVGQGAILCAGTIATVNVRIADFAMVNLACTLGHEATLGEACVLNPTVNVSGGVEIGPEVLVGTGAQILQYVKLGDSAVVGAGAVVTKDVEAGTTVVGVPAKPLSR